MSFELREKMDEVGVVFIDRRRLLCLCVCMCWVFLSISKYQSGISHVIKEIIFIYYFNIQYTVICKESRERGAVNEGFDWERGAAQEWDEIYDDVV